MDKWKKPVNIFHPSSHFGLKLVLNKFSLIAIFTFLYADLQWTLKINSLDKESVKKPEIRQSCLIPKQIAGYEKWEQLQLLEFSPFSFCSLDICPPVLAVTSVTHLVSKQLVGRAGSRGHWLCFAVSYSFCMRGKESSFCLTSMLCKFWIAKDLFAKLQAVSVLLVLITSLQKNRTDFTWYIWIQQPGLHCCTNPQTALWSARKGKSCKCAGVWTWLWSLLLQKNKASHGPNIASLAVQSVQDNSTEMNGRKSTWWDSIDDGGLSMKCNETSGQMNVPGSEQDTRSSKQKTLPTPTTVSALGSLTEQ